MPVKAPATARQRTVAQSELIEVEGVRLRVSIEGRGRPLLLLNGIGAAWELMAPLRNSLDEVETIAIDMPGAGGSDPFRLPPRLHGYTSITELALDVLGYGTVDVLGISWGGALAQEFAYRPLRACGGSGWQRRRTAGSPFPATRARCGR